MFFHPDWSRVKSQVQGVCVHNLECSSMEPTTVFGMLQEGFQVLWKTLGILKPGPQPYILMRDYLNSREPQLGKIGNIKIMNSNTDKLCPDVLCH